MKRSITSILIAVCALLTSACGQFGLKNPADTPVFVCPDASAVKSADLYGEWHARFDAAGARPAAQASVTFTPHAQDADALGGRIVRRGGDGSLRTSVLAGGTGDGRFGIEESSDGKAITGLWNGDLVPGRCGSEIRGIWIDPLDDSEQPFVLRRRQSGAAQIKRGRKRGR